MSSALLKIAAFGCILAVATGELTRDKRQLFVDSFGSSVVDPYVDQPLFAPSPRVVYRRPTVVVQRPSFYPEIFPQPLVRAYQPVYRQVVPQVFAEPAPLIVRRPSIAVAAPAATVIAPAFGPTLVSSPAVPIVAPAAVATDILMKKKKL
ncbi:hypothetical protein PRIPAC_79190 [Pristionchus pacificus]|uniref:Uncharacterized protein n=1 Tax=Pristionchus pacificus TaxID=54126 RepID=A0A2A6BXI9_PRIPA|nr:hypothetical protein PRIPAC_79190 [Pristionchus pacificus]|eukprot:PDM70722.1 hypothetical protein PRIPAC_44926 [Pristionchus pacificus]